jgi:MFS family permease
MRSRGPFIPFKMIVVVVPTAAVILGDSLIYIVLPVSVVEFGITGTFGLSTAFWIGLALSINRFVRLGSNALAASAYERFGLRWPFVAATALGAVTTLSYGFSKGAITLLIARALWGIAYSHLRLAAQLTALDLGGATGRGRMLGFFNSGQRFGSFAAVTLGAALADGTGRGVTFTTLAVIGFVGALVATQAPLTLGRRDRAPTEPAGGGQRIGSDDLEPVRFGLFWRVAIGSATTATGRIRKRMLGISIVRFSTAFAANGLVIATITPFLTELALDDATIFGLTVGIITLAGFLVGVRWFANLALAVPFGALSDKLGRRRVVVGGLIVMLASLLVISFTPSLEVVVAVLPILFLSGTLLETALDADMGDASPPEMRATAMARYSTWLDLGSATGPICGFLVGAAYGFGSSYAIGFAVVAGATGMYVVTSRSRRIPAAA